MTSSDPCKVCMMTGTMCRHKRTDLNNQSVLLFSEDSRNTNVPLQEFQFFGVDGGGSDSWLVDGPSYNVSGFLGVPVVAQQGFRYTDFLRNNCDPSQLTPDDSLLSGNTTTSTTNATTTAASTVKEPDVIGKTVLTSTTSLPNETTLPTGADVTDMDREARVLRYREKKKRRKFEKQIRYASRKAYAEMRPRVKGRFARVPDISQSSTIAPAYNNSGQFDMVWYQP